MTLQIYNGYIPFICDGKTCYKMTPLQNFPLIWCFYYSINMTHSNTSPNSTKHEACDAAESGSSIAILRNSSLIK